MSPFKRGESQTHLSLPNLPISASLGLCEPLDSDEGNREREDKPA